MSNTVRTKADARKILNLVREVSHMLTKPSEDDLEGTIRDNLLRGCLNLLDEIFVSSTEGKEFIC